MSDPPSEVCILVAEDDAISRYLMVRSLSDCGYCVLEAGDGLEALEVVASDQLHSIKVLISDMRMPRMDGRELVLQLKRSRPEIQVVIVTGSPQR